MNTFARMFRTMSFMLALLVAGWGMVNAQTVQVTIPNMAALPGSTVKIPINVGSLTGLDVTAYEFVVSCDTTIVRFTGVDASSTLSDGLGPVANYYVAPYGPGKMKVTCATATAMTGAGVLVYLTGTAQNTGVSTSVTLSNFLFNTGTPAANITNGSLRLSLNHAPTIGSVTPKSVVEKDTLRFTVTASDPDLPNDALTFSLGGAPTGATIDASAGAFLWVPAIGQAGSYSFRVKVTDLALASDSTTVSVTVTHALNHAPTIGSVTPKTIAEKDTLRFTAAATDPDLPNDALTFSLSGAPTGATINSSTGAFLWVPSFGQAGSYTFRVKVTDLGLASDSTTVSVTVTHTNQRPSFVTKMGDATINEGSTLTYSYSATDPDVGTVLTYSLQNPPTGATISSSGVLTFTPPANPARTYSIVAIASDGLLADTARATVTVNRKPTIIQHSPAVLTVVSQNKPAVFSVSAVNPDGGALTFQWKVNGVVDKSGPDSTYTKTFSDANGTPKLVACVVSNAVGLKDSVTWNFTITDVEKNDGAIPKEFALGQNYPNPFNPSTTIRFDLPKEAPVTMEIYNVLGVQVRSLLTGQAVSAGSHSMVWDGRDNNGITMPSGVYVYRISAGDFQASRKMTMVK